MAKSVHKPVLLKQVLNFFNPQPGDNFIDATVGEGGHALPILQRTAPDGKLLGIDWNREVLKKLRQMAKERIVADNQNRLILACGNFANLKAVVKRKKFVDVKGILFDLGLSSWLLEKSKRGFSFQKEEPLDMRFDQSQGITASEIVNKWPWQELKKIFVEYGELEEHIAQSIAQEIEKTRPLKTSRQLAGLVYRKKDKARLFQSLRIIVNNELENLEKGLNQAVNISQQVAVISFHSLEDRIAKKILGGELIKPSQEEIAKNSRARSAKMRILKKI